MVQHIFRLFILLSVTYHFSGYAQESTQTNLPEGGIIRFGKGGINTIRFTADGSRLIVGTNIGLWIYDVQTGNETGLLTNPPGQVNSLAFSSDGNTLTTCGNRNQSIQFWDLKTDQNERSQRGMLQVWDINNKEQLHIPSSEKVLTVAFSPNKPLLAVATLNGTKLYNLDNNGEFNDFSLDNLEVRGNTLIFSPNGNFLLSGNRDHGINLWNVYTGKKILDLSGHTNDIESIVFSYDGKMLASGSRDGTILLWDWEKITMKIKQNKDMDDGE